ncbi:RecA-like recombination protein [Klebsiella phage CPRSB]|nr:RecA-like recombination protein [Klebsiella phage CPRSB]
MSNKALLKKLIKNSNSQTASVLSESDVFNNITITRTRVPILNLALSGAFNGGLTSGLTPFRWPVQTLQIQLRFAYCSGVSQNV